MSNPYFRFKQFTVRHDKCAMKVGTDGTLLGAWTEVDDARRILDIGTGSGLIALMIAQRTAASLTAIDIDRDACAQAVENIRLSPFAAQIAVKQIDFNRFVEEHDPAAPFDRIVSNPPFFANALKCPDSQRAAARHADLLPLDDLIRGCATLLSEQGSVSLILPTEQQSALEYGMVKYGFCYRRFTNVVTTAGAAPKRILVELSRNRIDYIRDKLTIESSRGVFSEEYIRLMRDYYLRF